MEHKRTMGWLVCLALVGVLALAGPASAQGLSFKVRLYGGVSYLSGGDLNDGLQGYPDLLIDIAQSYGYTYTRQFYGAHWGSAFGGDFILQITPSLGIGLGVGYVRAVKESSVTVTAPSTTLTVTTKPDLRAMPLKLSLFYTLPAGAVTFNFHAGLGFYNTKASADLRLSEGGYWEDVLSETNPKWGIGFHGGLGLEFNIAPPLAFFVEIQGQYASISGYEGKLTDSTNMGYSSTVDGKLYYYEQNMFMNEYYGWVIIRPAPPSGSAYQNIREARVDFTGSQFLAGIVVKF